jgi:hypothetical protein
MQKKTSGKLKSEQAPETPSNPLLKYQDQDNTQLGVLWVAPPLVLAPPTETMVRR